MNKTISISKTISRTAAIALLATAVSAFAGSKKSATGKECNASNEGSQPTVNYVMDSSKAGQGNVNSKSVDDSSKRQTEQQNKEWLHDVQYIPAG